MLDRSSCGTGDGERAMSASPQIGPLLQAQAPSHLSTGQVDLPLSASDINRFIIDYLRIEGFQEAADRFKEEAETGNVADDYGDAAGRVHIRQEIQQGQIQSAIEMISDQYPELLDEDSTLHFHLLQQQLIELIRSGNPAAALKFAQERIAEKGELDASILSELERTMAMLAFQNPNASPFSDLLELAHRGTVARDVNSAILNAEGKPSAPQLEILLKLVYWCEEELSKRGLDYPKMENILNLNGTETTS